MLDPSHPIVRLLEEDRRYTFDAYVFLYEALEYAQNVLGMGADRPTEPMPEPAEEEQQAGPLHHPTPDDSFRLDNLAEVEEQAGPQRHVSGQELCEAIRHYALQQYGYMAKTVLNSWGIHGTTDFGEIVFNLIRIGQMRKTSSDTLVDFNDIYDFDVAFKQQFKITPPEQ
jgi:uncharacterized repeat protein (TIGR04138 family)